jgi:hypothetical protein
MVVMKLELNEYEIQNAIAQYLFDKIGMPVSQHDIKLFSSDDHITAVFEMPIRETMKINQEDKND